MNANDVIESYVTDVAVLLPRRQRNDVAFELRALLGEGLQDKADGEGRTADAALAVEFLRAFGSPAEVAARYRPALTIIDPADGGSFLRLAVIGLAIIWALGLLMTLSRPMGASGTLGAIGQWWTSTVIPSLWWPGALVVGFGLANWARRRWPQFSHWKPRAGDRLPGGRVAVAMGLVGIACGVAVLVEPRWVLDFFWGGRAAPAAYEALTYTDTFRSRQGPALLAMILTNIPLLATVLVNGRWSPTMRRVEMVLGLVTCAVMAWAIMAGPIFPVESSDKTAKFFMALIIGFTLLHFAIRQYRAVRPMANTQAHAR